MKNELILLPSLQAQRGPNGGFVLTKKYLNGMAEFAKNWPGEVTSLVSINNTPTSDMDHVEVSQKNFEQNIEIRPSNSVEFSQRLRNASTVLAFLSPYELKTAKICSEIKTPLVFTSEYSVRTECQIIDSETTNIILRLRRKLWVQQADKKRIQALSLAAGLQCSGSPTYDAYNHLIDNSLLFFDNRVPLKDVISQDELEKKLAVLSKPDPIRLVFGGRLISMKGVLELPKIAKELKSLSVKFELAIYGSGNLERQLEDDIENLDLKNEVKLCGVREFRSEWLPILKNEADLFVCCHTQGDPSSTYPEVMSCGLPIVGYDNDAFKGIVHYSDSGWATEMYNPKELAILVRDLANNREQIKIAARKARMFARQHAFEETFKARTNQLIEVSR